jgi:para-nitrobenzyl esterase
LAAISAATKDLQDAVQFITKKTNDLGIDTKKIILCGSSAGAETVLSKVYNHSLFDIKADDIRYAGIISLAGAIVDTSIITREMAIPTMLFHGTNDNLVPYETAPHHYCPEGSEGYLILNGSQSIADKLGKLGGAFWLCSVCGEDHSISWKPMSDYFDDIITFCYDFVLHRSKRQVHIVIPCKAESNYSENGDNGINPSG